MSTRSRIGRKNADDTITSIYCHFDGHPSHVGAILSAHYTSPAKVDALIALGDLSSLREECESPPEGHSHDSSAKGHTVAYGRDRGETDVDAVTHAADAWPDSGQKYTYLFDGAAWAVWRKGEWRPVADVLAEDDAD